MNELEIYKAIAKAAEEYRRRYMTFSEELAKSIKETYKSSLTKQIASLRLDTSWVDRYRSTVEELSRTIRSPAVELARSANASIAQMVEETVRPMRELAEQISSISEAWKEKLQPTHVLLDSIVASETGLRAHLAEISKVTILAQGSLS